MEKFKEASLYEQQQMFEEWSDMIAEWRRAYIELHPELQPHDFDEITGVDTSTPETTSTTGAQGFSEKGGPDSTQSWITEQPIIRRVPRQETFMQRAQREVTERTTTAATQVQSLLRRLVGNEGGARYASGGIANGTGPAWLDGTMQAPERVLSPRQTEAFEQLVSLLDRVWVGNPLSGYSPELNTENGTIYFGDINIEVNGLSEDSDYSDTADRLMEEIAYKMNRGKPVGGLRTSKT